MDCSPPCPLCSWNSPGRNTGVGCHALLQRVFLTQGLKLSLPHCRQIHSLIVTIWANREALTFRNLLLLLFVSKIFFFYSFMSFLVLWYPFHYIIHAFLPILVKCPLKSSWLINLHCLFRSWKPIPMVLLITFLISEGCKVLPVQFHTGVPVFAVFSLIPLTLCEETTSCPYVKTILFFKDAFKKNKKTDFFFSI